jgi:Tol biopolymer transport system component
LRATALVAIACAILCAGAASRPLPVAYGSPSWSPDGKHLVFVSARGPKGWIVSVRATGASLRRLTLANFPFQVAWSPRGDRIAYSTSAGLFVIGRDGTTKRRLGVGTDIAWAPDGTRIAFTGVGSSGPIQVVNADGTGHRQVTNGRYDRSPAWSPDGRIVFGRATGAGDVQDLFVIGADGTGLRPFGRQGAAPAWSPDGSRITYWRRTQSGVALAVANADGTDELTLTRSVPSFSGVPQWSSDSRRLLFNICSPFGPCRIDVAEADGTSVRRIATGQDPVWAPNAHRVAFTTRRLCRSSGIFLVNPDGTRLKQITPCR